MKVDPNCIDVRRRLESEDQSWNAMLWQRWPGYQNIHHSELEWRVLKFWKSAKREFCQLSWNRAYGQWDSVRIYWPWLISCNYCFFPLLSSQSALCTVARQHTPMTVQTAFWMHAWTKAFKTLWLLLCMTLAKTSHQSVHITSVHALFAYCTFIMRSLSALYAITVCSDYLFLKELSDISM